MRFDDEVAIDATAAHVWAVYSDVERWPDWTASVRGVRFEMGDAVAVGNRVRIEQPKLPVAVWEVRAVDPGRSWTWVARGPGIVTTATHTLDPVAPTVTRVHQRLEYAGPVGAVMARVYAGLTRRYLAMEAAGLKRRCEAPA